MQEEIAAILKKENVHPDLEKAGAKIDELQEKLTSLGRWIIYNLAR